MSVRSPRRRRRVGRFMRWLAVFGVLTAFGGAVTGWQLMGQIDTTLTESLEITEESLVTLEETIVLADDILDSVDEALLATEGTLRAVVDSTDDAATVIESVEGLVGDVAPSLGNVESTLRDLSDIGSTIDSVLEQLDNIPFGPDYDPQRPLGEQLNRLADDIEPIATSLEDAAEPLAGLATASGDLETEVGALADAIGDVNIELQSSGALLDSYLETARRARVLATAADDDLGAEIARARAFLVLAALMVGLGQVVPWWIGNELVQSVGELDDEEEQIQSNSPRGSRHR